MSKRLPVTPSAAPLELYAEQFDPFFSKRNQRDGFRRYIEGLLRPIARNKTLTALANSQPLDGAHQSRAQRLQWFLSESKWDPDLINQHRVTLLVDDPLTAPHGRGVLVVDETGDRKEGTKIAYAGQQYLSSSGKVDNGVVSFTALWADEHVFYPLRFEPYIPAHHFPRGSADPEFRTKPQLACRAVEQALAAQVPFCAVIADCFNGEHEELAEGLQQLNVGYVLSLKSCHSWLHPLDDLSVLAQAARRSAWHGGDNPGAWLPVQRTFRDGHTETWWALEVCADQYDPEAATRAVVATTDPIELPAATTWFLVTNLAVPGTARATTSDWAAADVAELIRLYSLRVWVEQSYKQIKSALGWGQYQVRSAVAIRRHWQLVCCAFSFYWWHRSHPQEELEPVLSAQA